MYYFFAEKENDATFWVRKWIFFSISDHDFKKHKFHLNIKISLTITHQCSSIFMKSQGNNFESISNRKTSHVSLCSKRMNVGIFDKRNIFRCFQTWIIFWPFADYCFTREWKKWTKGKKETWFLMEIDFSKVLQKRFQTKLKNLQHYQPKINNASIDFLPELLFSGSRQYE